MIKDDEGGGDDDEDAGLSSVLSSPEKAIRRQSLLFTSPAMSNELSLNP